jgi:undecaprenyl pyrophosphate phosphatase UppP
MSEMSRLSIIIIIIFICISALFLYESIKNQTVLYWLIFFLFIGIQLCIVIIKDYKRSKSLKKKDINTNEQGK